MLKSIGGTIKGIALLLALAGASTNNAHATSQAVEPPARAEATAATSFIAEVQSTPMPLVDDDETWVRIDLTKRDMTVYQGRKIVASIPHVAIGQSGAKRIRLKGSQMTPIGEFKIERINRRSQFNTFYGINYPTPGLVAEALDRGLITPAEYRRFMHDKQRSRMTPAYTPLGGHIGIHGLGHRDADIHKLYDWTDGCLAIENAELEAIDPWLRQGTKVLIHG